MTKVYVARNNAILHPAKMELLTSGMPGDVREKAAKYRRWQDAQAFLWGRYLLATGLQAFQFDKKLLEQMQYTAYNKPYLPIPLDFNISHSGDYILCALSTGKTGVDIEQIRPLVIDDFTSCFSEHELATIQNSSDVYQEFFRHWTVKEAVIKAEGKGMYLPLNTIPVADKLEIEGNTWFIHQLDIAPGYLAHLATSAANTAIEIKWISI